jgi:hypothetical protein
MNIEEIAEYRGFVPRRMNGTSMVPDFNKAFRFCYDVVMTRQLAARAAELVNPSRALLASSDLKALRVSEEAALQVEAQESQDSWELQQRTPQRVLLVVESKEHGRAVAERLLQTHGFQPIEMLMVGYDECVTSSGVKLPSMQSVFITESSVLHGKSPAVSIMIVAQRFAEGWTATWCTTMLTSVYPSNQATREQMEGRINRLSCERKVRWTERLHTGILTYVLKNHVKAQSLSHVLQQLATEYMDN